MELFLQQVLPILSCLELDHVVTGQVRSHVCARIEPWSNIKVPFLVQTCQYLNLVGTWQTHGRPLVLKGLDLLVRVWFPFFNEMVLKLD